MCCDLTETAHAFLINYFVAVVSLMNQHHKVPSSCLHVLPTSQSFAVKMRLSLEIRSQFFKLNILNLSSSLFVP